MCVVLLHDYPIHYKNLLIRALRERGVDLKVIYVAPSSLLRGEQINLSLESYPFSLASKAPFEKAISFRRSALVWKALNQFRPAVVIIHGYHLQECWTAWLWARLNKRPIVLWFESNSFDLTRRWWKEAIKRYFVKHCFSANTYGKTSSDYIHQLGMPKRQIVVKGAIVDYESFGAVFPLRSARHSKIKKLLYVGRLAPEKNLEFLLRTLSQFNEKQPGLITLTIAGGGPLAPHLKMLSERLGMSDSVTFLGYVAQAKVPQVMLDSDALVLPSTYEPWGLIAAEAMLTGMPVILSDRCGCATDLLTSTTGWMFNPTRSSELESCLRRFVEATPEEMSDFGAAAHRSASRFNPQAAAERVERTLESTLAKAERV